MTNENLSSGTSAPRTFLFIDDDAILRNVRALPVMEQEQIAFQVHSSDVQAFIDGIVHFHDQHIDVVFIGIGTDLSSRVAFLKQLAELGYFPESQIIVEIDDQTELENNLQLQGAVASTQQALPERFHLYDAEKYRRWDEYAALLDALGE